MIYFLHFPCLCFFSGLILSSEARTAQLGTELPLKELQMPCQTGVMLMWHREATPGGRGPQSQLHWNFDFLSFLVVIVVKLGNRARAAVRQDRYGRQYYQTPHTWRAPSRGRGSLVR